MDSDPLTLLGGGWLGCFGTPFVAKVSPGFDDCCDSHGWALALEVALLCLLCHIAVAPTGAENFIRRFVGFLVGFRHGGKGDSRWDKKIQVRTMSYLVTGSFLKLFYSNHQLAHPHSRSSMGNNKRKRADDGMYSALSHMMTPAGLCVQHLHR